MEKFCRFFLYLALLYGTIKKHFRTMGVDKMDPNVKKQLEIPAIAKWVFFTLGTSALPIIIRIMIMLLTSRTPTITEMRSELFFLVVLCLVDTMKNCRHQAVWMLSMTFALIICSIIYGMALAEYMGLLATELFGEFDTLMIFMVIISVVLDAFTTIKYGD